jgi:hypothetical protein
MTAARMADIGRSHGLVVVGQKFRNDHDCVTVFKKS